MPNIIEIHDLDLPALEPYRCTSEVQLLRYYEPKEGIFIAESPKVIRRALSAGYEPISFLVERKYIDGQASDIIAGCGDVPVYTAHSDVLTQLTGFRLTQGALCAMRRKALSDAAELISGAQRIAVLEDIMNQTNVGAIFRSAAALGFDAVVLTSGCSDPLYRRAIRVSMGTVFQVSWARLGEKNNEWPAAGMDRLHKLGFKTAAMALDDRAVSVEDPVLQAEDKLAIVLGTEGDGLAANTIARCDYTVMIPMQHGVDSLNVAAAGAVAFWELRKR